MKVLLDTNVLLWAMLDPRQLTSSARATITSSTTEILVSAASAWEIATKVRIGKLPWAAGFERSFTSSLEGAGYNLLSITPEIALRAGRLPGAHRDPFDRIIAAHALAEDIPVISADSQLESFGLRRLW